MWEYHTETVPTPNLDAVLTALGAQGWELVTAARTVELIHIVQEDGVSRQALDAFDLIFKRHLTVGES